MLGEATGGRAGCEHGPATELRDYRAWHRAYDDPRSALSWRLERVRQYLRSALDERAGLVRLLSSCSGDGRDVLGVLAERADAERVSGVLLEVDPVIAQSARDSAAAAGLAGVEVRTVDAGYSDAYLGAAPADVVLLVGILGNLSDADVARTVAFAPQLCRPDATLLWSRGLDSGHDSNDALRSAFEAVGFAELAYAVGPGDPDRTRPALGVVRYEGPTVDLLSGRRVFTFVR